MADIIKYIIMGSIPLMSLAAHVSICPSSSLLHEQLSSSLKRRKKRFCWGEFAHSLETLILGHLEILHKNKLVCHALFAAKNKWHPGLHFGVRERAHQEHLLELVVVTN